VTLAEAKGVLTRVCTDEASSNIRRAIEALPDRTRLDQLDPLVRGLIETRLYQLVPLGVVS
jgi:hypothetical protein